MVNIHQYWVYIMSNKTRSVLYTGVTNDLYRRYCEHRDGTINGFTQRYRCHSLLYYEEYNYVDDAINREKELKGWKREKKELLIRTVNPRMIDLADSLDWTDANI